MFNFNSRLVETHTIEKHDKVIPHIGFILDTARLFRDEIFGIVIETYETLGESDDCDFYLLVSVEFDQITYLAKHEAEPKTITINDLKRYIRVTIMSFEFNDDKRTSTGLSPNDFDNLFGMN